MENKEESKIETKKEIISDSALVASYRIPVKIRKSHNRFFFRLFIVSFLVLGMTTGISIYCVVKLYQGKNAYQKIHEKQLDFEINKISFDSSKSQLRIFYDIYGSWMYLDNNDSVYYKLIMPDDQVISGTDFSIHISIEKGPDNDLTAVYSAKAHCMHSHHVFESIVPYTDGLCRMEFYYKNIMIKTLRFRVEK